MKHLSHILLLVIVFVLTYFDLSAQATIADNLMAGNKLASVVVILAIILAGILLFLFRLERRIKKMEDEIKI